MIAELNSILGVSADDVRQGEFILLSDRHADASFLIHHYLSFYLKARCKVCFLGLVQSFSHYSAVGQKLGVNLAQARERGQLVFLEALKASPDALLNESHRSRPLDYLRSGELRSLYEYVASSLSVCEPEGESRGPPVLIIDDLSVFLSLGVGLRAVLDFLQYCRASICSQSQGSIVTLVRLDDDDEEEEEEEEEEESDEGSGRLLRALTHQCSLSLAVTGLSSGYCRDIHGQVEIWWRGTGVDVSARRKVFQYKLHDKGASFFAPGTSSAVL